MLAGEPRTARRRPPRPPRRRMNPVKALILVYFLTFATVVAFVQPVFEAPDENAHVAYINFLAEHGELPNQYDPDRAVPWEGHQPPLYYALAAVPVRLFKHDHRLTVCLERNRKSPWVDGQFVDRPVYDHRSRGVFPSRADRVLFYSLRLFSVVLGAANLLLIFGLAALVFDDRWSVWPALFVATLPQFGFISGVINNDNLASLAGTATAYLLFRIAGRPGGLKNYLGLGIALGLGILTKKTLLFLVPGAVVLVTYLAWTDRSRCRRIIGAAALAGLIAALLSGWWFWRNHRLYGEWLGSQMERETMPLIVREKSLRDEFFTGRVVRDLVGTLTGTVTATPSGPRPATYGPWGLGVGVAVVLAGGLLAYLAVRSARNRGGAFAWWVVGAAGVLASLYPVEPAGLLFGRFFEGLFATFVGVFGYVQIELPYPFYRLYGWIALVAAVGLAWNLVRMRGGDIRIVTGLILFAAGYAGVAHYNLTYTNTQGRWLFPAVGVVGVLAAVGVREIVSRLVPPVVRRVIVTAVVMGMLAADWVTIGLLSSFYYDPNQYR